MKERMTRNLRADTRIPKCLHEVSGLGNPTSAIKLRLPKHIDDEDLQLSEGQ